MLKYRSLKVLSDIWLKGLHALMSFEDFVHACAEKVIESTRKTADKAVAYGIKLDEKAVELAHDAHDSIVQEHSNRLEAIATIVDDAEAQGKELIRRAEAAAVLLVGRARTVENDTIDAYGAAVTKARAFLDKAIDYHA